ncbi:MAG: hypothetical protein CVV03_04525 [Firmicutes bacterium HGW-Firmicutes-8]|nr:MAG: hypothetical protein CVV03_04525 [Firmicutes bacterium HGW-Firmicutes-8]
MFTGLVWVEFFFMFVVMMLIAVPRTKIIQFLPVGAIGGFGLSLLLNALLVTVLGWWRFNFANIFSLAGIPIFITLAWTPVVIIYAYYLDFVKGFNRVISYMLGFTLATGLYVHWLAAGGFITYIRWNSLYTFVLAFILYSPVTYYLLKTRNLLPTPESD